MNEAGAPSGAAAVAQPQSPLQESQTNAAQTHSEPRCAPGQEIRFAVVMYGGVSLAIYINGITQELLHMVRATAPADSTRTKALLGNDELSGSQRVYRLLGQCMQAWRERDPDVRQILSDAVGDDAARRRAADALSAREISTRFMVDILSGTSAGGINAMFLAKAIANTQSVEGLKNLWVSEGDFGLLINDKESYEKLPFSLAGPQSSLLNSQRMYRKLLEALDQMEQTEPKTVSDAPLHTK